MTAIKFQNTSDTPVNLYSLGLGIVPPKGVIDVPLELAAPSRRDNDSRGRSAIEKCAPQMQPVDPVIAEAWKQVPDPLPPKSLMVTTERRAPDEPAGVKALREAAAALASKAPSEPAAGAKDAKGEKGQG